MDIIDQMRPRPLPEYYDTMYRDGYKPWEILEAAHNTMMNQHEARVAERQEQMPMNVNFTVEVRMK